MLQSGGASVGNKVDIMSDGSLAFREMWAAINSAEKSIHIETYILKMDSIGLHTIELLRCAALRGVDVSLVYDSVGSTSLCMLRSGALDSLRSAGGKVFEFNPVRLSFWNPHHRFFHRNHRKILVVDDKVAFCGSLNIGREYCGKDVGGTGENRDTHVKLEGPAARHLSMIAQESVYEAKLAVEAAISAVSGPAAASETHANVASLQAEHTDEIQTKFPAKTATRRTSGQRGQTAAPARWRPLAQLRANLSALRARRGGGTTEEEGACVQVLASNSWRSRRDLQKSLRLAVQHSAHKCYITSPYLFPPPRLIHALTSAARRGVDVRVLGSGDKCDIPGLQFASRYLVSALVRAGVRVYEYQPANLHSKTACVDGVFGYLGSFNFDRWSDSRNLEVGVALYDTELTRKVEDEFLDNITRSKEITPESVESQSWAQRAIHWICAKIATVPDFI